MPPDPGVTVGDGRMAALDAVMPRVAATQSPWIKDQST
jgi:hypothetical protein